MLAGLIIMKQDNLSHYLDDADQSVKNFIASLLDAFSNQIKKEDAPLVQLEYFGARMEVRLLAFEGVYDPSKDNPQCTKLSKS